MHVLSNTCQGHAYHGNGHGVLFLTAALPARDSREKDDESSPVFMGSASLEAGAAAKSLQIADDNHSLKSCK